MPYVLCTICSRNFYAKPSHIAKGWGKYCSKKCQYSSQRTGKNVPCFRCGKEIYRDIKSQTRSLSGKFFCDKSCQTIWRNKQYTQEKHANWVNGKSSYRSVLLRENRALECEKCKDTDKRILAVHHKDRNRYNNKPNNLIWLCYNCHFLVHNYVYESKGFIIG